MLPPGEYALPDQPVGRVVVKSQRGMPLIVLTALFTIFDNYMLTNLNPKNPRLLADPRLSLVYEDSDPVADGDYNSDSITIGLYRNSKRGKKTYGKDCMSLWNTVLLKEGEKREIKTSWDRCRLPYLYLLLHELGHHLDSFFPQGSNLSDKYNRVIMTAWVKGVYDYYESVIAENQGKRNGISREALIEDRDAVIRHPVQTFPLTKDNIRANHQYYASLVEQVAELHALYCLDQRLKKELRSMTFRGTNLTYGGIHKEATEHFEPLYRVLKKRFFANPKTLRKLKGVQREMNRHVKELVANRDRQKKRTALTV